MIDLKGWGDSVHHTLTGYGRERVLASLTLLVQAGKLAEVRLLQVPGQSDYLAADGTLEDGLAAFLRALGPVPIRLNGFRHHGVRGAAQDWPEATREELEQLAAALAVAGLGPVSLPPLL